MTFHEKLARLTAYMKRAAICRSLGMPENAMGNLLHRKQMPAADTALKFARALGVSVEWLIDEEQDWPPVRSSEPELHAEHAA